MRKDKNHDAVVTALRKQGWIASPKPFRIVMGLRNLYVDIQALRLEKEEAIFVEVKTFDETASPVEVFTQAMGQYALYRFALDAIGNNAPLYLAVPESAVAGILSEKLGQIVIARLNMKLVVYDAQSEEIVQWI